MADRTSHSEALTGRVDSMALSPSEMRDVLVMLSGGAPDELEAALNFTQRVRDLVAVLPHGETDVLLRARAASPRRDG